MNYTFLILGEQILSCPKVGLDGLYCAYCPFKPSEKGQNMPHKIENYSAWMASSSGNALNPSP